MITLEDVFLNTNYVLYLNVVIASVIAVMTFVGVRRDLLFPFVTGWVVLFLITSSIRNELQFDRIGDELDRLGREDPDLIDTLESNRAAYDYLTENLSWATTFKNTVYGTNPPELKKHRKRYVEKTEQRLRDDAFKMHEIFSEHGEHRDEAGRKMDAAAQNYYCSFVDDEGCPLLPFSILENERAGREEVILGWYGEVRNPHDEDMYLVIREQNFVDLMQDYFRSSFAMGDTPHPEDGHDRTDE